MRYYCRQKEGRNSSGSVSLICSGTYNLDFHSKKGAVAKEVRVSFYFEGGGVERRAAGGAIACVCGGDLARARMNTGRFVWSSM